MRRPWIKIEICTPDKPEICSLATQLKMEDDAVVGKLVRLWSWAELNRINPNDIGVTKEFIDKLVGRKGFALALKKIGWLIETDETLSFRNFKRHNSPLAQNKALTAKRVARHRLRKSAKAEKETLPSLPKTPSVELAPEDRHEQENNVSEVIINGDSLIISKNAENQTDTEVVESITMLSEPVTEPAPVVDEPAIEPASALEEPAIEPPSAVEEEETVVKSPSAMPEPEAPLPEIVEEGVMAPQVEEPAPRKRRGKAVADTGEQPMLF